MLALLLALTTVALGDHHDDHGDHDNDQDHHDDDDDHHDDDHHDHKEDFDNIDHRLDKLTARIEHIRENIHRRTNPRVIRQARSLKARVQKLECTYSNHSCSQLYLTKP